MRVTVRRLRHIIRESLTEMMVTGALRKTKDNSGSGRKVRIGKADPDENQQLSVGEAEMQFPGSIDAWAEVVPDMFPDFPWSDPVSINRGSSYFRIGDRLRVSFKDVPGVELAEWDPVRQDWFPLD